MRIPIKGSWQRRERALARIPPDSQTVWRTQFQALATDCGCKEGMAAMVFGGTVWTLYVLTGGGYAAAWINVAFGVGVLVGSATIGKLLGLARARTRSWRLLQRLEVYSAKTPR